MQMFLDRLGALSPTSQCHVFGADADGYGRADGFVGFFLKDLQTATRDRDAIHAVIRGTAVNSNGRTGGITHPSPKSQQAAMRQAYRCAGNLDPRDTAYYECHGTGTAVGDPLEVKGIQEFFASRTCDNPLLLGSVKTNIGHGGPVSGLSGLLKAVLAIKNGTIPPMIVPKVINPNLNLDHARFRLLSEPHKWPKHLPRRASVASSGFGGANAHAIVEEYIPTHAGSPELYNDGSENETIRGDHQQKHLLPFSAHKLDSLTSTAAAIFKVSSRHRLVDLAYTLGVRRSRMLYKGFGIIAEDLPQSIDQSLRVAKRLRTTTPRIGFVFTGQGAQWPQMGKELFRRFPVFRASIRRMSSVLHGLSDGPRWNLKDILLAPKSTSLVYSAEISQPACTALQIAIVAVLKSWGIAPTACMGHSSGEMAAAHAADLITDHEAIIAAYYRGQSVTKLNRKGAMIAVGIGAEPAQKYLTSLEPRIRIAAVNSPESITVSGDADAIETLGAILAKDGIFNRMLATGGKAYHSDQMTEVGEVFEASMRRSFCSNPESAKGEAATPFFSSVLGECLPQDFHVTPLYWRQNLENPVLFSPALSAMVESGIDHLIEIGPHSALAGPIRQLEQQFRGLSQQFPLYSPTLIRGRDGEDCMLELAGHLFNDGAEINIEEVNRSAGSQRKDQATPVILTDLPTYQYAYGPSSQRTNRLDQEFRNPEHAYDSLLGSKILGSSPSAPAWRNILTEKDLPVLSGKRHLGLVQIPASCLLMMTLRAAQQAASLRFNQPSTTQFVAMKDVRFPRMLTLDEPRDVVTSLQEDSENTDLIHFQISSIERGSATVHCSGRIAFDSKGARVHEDLTVPPSCRTHAPIDIAPSKFYKALEDTGVYCDKRWQVLNQIDGNPMEDYVRCDELKPLEGLSQQVGPIEATLQLAALSVTPALQPRNLLRSLRPTKIKSVVFRQSARDSPACVAIARGQPATSAHARVASGRTLSRDGDCVVLLEEVSMEETSEIERPDDVHGQCLELIKKLDFETMRQDEAETVFPAPPFPGAEIFNKVHKLASAMVMCFMSREEARPKAFWEAGKSLMEWLESASLWANDSQILYVADLMHMPPDELSRVIDSLYEEVAEESVEARLMMRMYRSLTGVLEGTVSAHDLLMNGGLLSKLYTSTLTASGSMIQLRRLVDLVGHKNPSARYLEIGGGTRGATREVLDVLGARHGAKRYSSYCFTDVSSYFLSGARDEFRECDGISYATLNIEVSPLEQGFEEKGYDVIVAANVLHATSSVQRTLEHARLLLKPGGKLILVETTIETAWLTIVLGGFADYWKGRRDGRPTSPFIPVTEWSRILQKSGFTAPQIDLPDYEPQFRTMNVLLATAADENNVAPTDVCDLTSEVERFYPLPNAKGAEKTSDSAIHNPRLHSKTFVLIDATEDYFFVELTLWLVESGVRCLILARSRACKGNDDEDAASTHVEKLRSLGVQVVVFPELLTAVDESRVVGKLNAVTPEIGGIIFGRPSKGASYSYTSTNIANSHSQARKIFTAAYKPGSVLVLADSSAVLPSASQHDAALADAIRGQADLWSSVDAPSIVLNLGREEGTDDSSMTDVTTFDQIAPQLKTLLSSAHLAETHSGCFVYDMSPVYLAGYSTKLGVIESLKRDERWSVLLQAMEYLAMAQNATAIDQAITPKAAALARYFSTAEIGGTVHHDAATDAVAATLAEILFLPREQINVEQRPTNSGIDSLVASELKSQLKQSFAKDFQTDWLLSGEVTLADVVNHILDA